MTLHSEDLQRTAAAAARIVIAERTGSTNTDLVRNRAQDPEAWPNLSVLVTDDQTDGRGRLGRSWTAPAGTALAVSVVLDVAGVGQADRGWVPLLAGVAVTRAIAAQLDETHTVRMKWPNDVLVDGRKISGILAEAVPGAPAAIVVGTGVNTAMAPEQLPVPTATSFATLGISVTPELIDTVLADYLTALGELVGALLLEGGDASSSGVHDEVEALCATLGSSVRVHLPDGSELVGEALRLGPHGELVVRTGVDETSVVAGDVVHVR
ncbi:MAG TPA: biotin--[acetyl-CoA-carboxylase] ligase [Microbacterium sp.]|nr:biotin--[acetyl-CoA-carboxylase] ligase [Microbacterium sp.]